MPIIVDHPVIDNATPYLHSPIVYILAKFPNGKVIQGSGVMVGANSVLTASHVVYSVRNGGAAVLTTVTPAYDGSSRPYGSYAASNIHYNTVDDSGGVIKASEVPLDFAVISLKTPLGLKTGFFRLDRNFSTGVANITSYPATQKGHMTYAEANTSLKRFPCGADYFDITDFGISQGSSGGAVYKMKNGVPYVFGVVSTVTWSAPIADSETVSAYSKIISYISSDHQYVAKSLPVLNLSNQKIAVGKNAVKSYTYQFKGSFPVPVTSDVTVATESGTALAGVDFDNYNDNVTIDANATTGSVNLNIHPNWDAHPGVKTLEFSLVFSNPQAAVFANSYAVAKANISITRDEPAQVVLELAANHVKQNRTDIAMAETMVR